MRWRRHRHQWVNVASRVVQTYYSWGGIPMTDKPSETVTKVLQRCAVCPEVRTRTLDGYWEFAEINKRG